MFGAALFSGPSCASARYAETSQYVQRDVEGLRILVSAEAPPEDAERAFAILSKKLAELRGLVRHDAYRRLQDVRIWVEVRERGRAMAGYHGAAWVAAHRLNPEKARGIEIADAGAFFSALERDKPMAVAHELAHAYLDRVEIDVATPWSAAVRSGKYDRVRTRRGTVERAYALESASEYFAELTEAYLGENDYEPFDRRALASFDPAGLELMRATWG
jgi:hypothetical protein